MTRLIDLALRRRFCCGCLEVTRRLRVALACTALLGLSLSIASAAAEPADLRLLEAVQRRDLAAVKASLAAGADVNARQPDGATALLWAAQWNEIELARMLTAKGADANAANDFGVMPLSQAALNGSADMIDLLLKAGASVNRALPTGETPLMTAALVGRVDAVARLLGADADVNATEGTRGQTALMWALAEGHTDVARELVARGADINARSASGFTPLLFAVRHGDLDTVRYLLERGANLHEAANDGSSALLVATVRGHVDLALFLLERGADPNDDRAGYTALHWAAGYWETATTITYGDEAENWRALSGVPKLRQLEFITALLARGAAVNVRIKKAPALGGGAVGRIGSVVIGCGPMIGASPFWLATLGGEADVMRLLVAHGADPLLPAADGSTAAMVAAGQTAFSLNSSISEAAHLAAVSLALDLGVPVDAMNAQGNTAMHIAAHAGWDSVVSELARRGAPLNWKNKAGNTPLRIADGVEVIMMVYEHPKTAALLRSLGATQ